MARAERYPTKAAWEDPHAQPPRPPAPPRAGGAGAKPRPLRLSLRPGSGLRGPRSGRRRMTQGVWTATSSRAHTRAGPGADPRPRRKTAHEDQEGAMTMTMTVAHLIVAGALVCRSAVLHVPTEGSRAPSSRARRSGAAAARWLLGGALILPIALLPAVPARAGLHQWSPSGLANVGPVHSIAVDPTNPLIVYAGTEVSGVVAAPSSRARTAARPGPSRTSTCRAASTAASPSMPRRPPRSTRREEPSTRA